MSSGQKKKLLERAQELSREAARRKEAREAEERKAKIAEWEADERRIAKDIIKSVPKLIEDVVNDPDARAHCRLLSWISTHEPEDFRRMPIIGDPKTFKGAAAILRDWAESEGFSVSGHSWGLRGGARTQYVLGINW